MATRVYRVGMASSMNRIGGGTGSGTRPDETNIQSTVTTQREQGAVEVATDTRLFAIMRTREPLAWMTCVSMVEETGAANSTYRFHGPDERTTGLDVAKVVRPFCCVTRSSVESTPFRTSKGYAMPSCVRCV